MEKLLDGWRLDASTYEDLLAVLRENLESGASAAEKGAGDADRGTEASLKTLRGALTAARK